MFIKIISKFHDYYDALQAHGADDDLLMLRETQTHERGSPYTFLINALSFAASPDRYRWNVTSYPATREWSELSIKVGVVVFVGKAYPFYKACRRSKATQLPEDRFFYDLKDLDPLVIEHGGKSLFEKRTESVYSRNRIIRGHGYKSWALAIHDQAKALDFTKQLTELKMPIVLLEEEGKCTTYPNLRFVQFMKAVEPWQAYQELSMFLGNIAAPDRVPVTLADKDRVQQHGFDMTYGFRTRPK